MTSMGRSPSYSSLQETGRGRCEDGERLVHAALLEHTKLLLGRLLGTLLRVLGDFVVRRQPEVLADLLLQLLISPVEPADPYV